ncbi:histidine kinase N-terminal 7TM domain-containing protein [Lachnospiraceae bacterium HCP28S3_F9]|uniref:histidine kinase N-terminal 7TM domain-containing protein n=1 Tax=Blautia obeum TaxID=40520 RepID=UPI002A8F48B2|nr:histidine kinase N-terminal 7TM domain-containing protein [Lachnospiraceae bacterium]
MTKSNSKKYSTILYVALAIFTAMVLRQIARWADAPLDWFCGMIRSAIYIELFIAWGVSLHRRIIQPQVRRYLTSISVLVVFWMTVRTIRYSLDECIWLMRYLWYLYYLPMLLIPLLAVFVALSLGKPDNFRLSKWTGLLYIPTAALLLLVLTNDLHQFVFVFPEDAIVWVNDYSYALGYFLAVGWVVSCTITALVVMLIKCRIPHSRTVLMLPFAPAVVALIYGVLYYFRVPWLKFLTGDMTVVFCLLIVAILECCIECGLIQSNTGYEELFMVSRLGAQITNQENAVCLASANARALTEEQRISTKTQTVSADKSMIVKSQPIGFGHVLWQENVAELTEAIEQIEENCRDLAEHNRIRQENLKTRKKILALQEKNRVSDLLHRETAGQIDLIDRMLAQYDTETDDRKRSRLLGGAAVVGAYIKRYGNLLLIGERTETADIRDLARCFDESFINLELLGVNCLHTLPSDIILATKDMLQVYRSFEAAVETSLSDLQYVWINVRESKEGIFLNMEFVCDTDLSPFASIADSFSCEDGAYRFTFKLRKGGEEK